MERRSLKKSRHQRDSNPWPPRYWCDALPTASHRYCGGHEFESRWSLDFFRLPLSNCLNWKIYCDDHSSLWSTTAVEIYELFHIYSTSKIKQFQRTLTFYVKVKKDTTQDKKDFWGTKGTKRGHSRQKGRRGTFLTLCFSLGARGISPGTRAHCCQKTRHG